MLVRSLVRVVSVVCVMRVTGMVVLAVRVVCVWRVRLHVIHVHVSRSTVEPDQNGRYV